MSILGDPYYDKAQLITEQVLNKMDFNELIFSYLCIEVDFKFSDETKYPCIPTRVDNDVDIYPLKGTSVITGVEYLKAKNMGCVLKVKNCVYVPFRLLKEIEKT